MLFVDSYFYNRNVVRLCLLAQMAQLDIMILTALPVLLKPAGTQT